jgi:predicted P-loop ATPase
MQMTAGVIASSLTVLEAATMVAEENPFHPVRDYLDGLVWDGKHRLDDWLSTYLGATVEPSDDKLNGKDKEEDQKRFAAQSAYLKAIGSRWMIGAVRRIYRPGEKVDCALVLVGPQGILKSTVFSVLGGEWFTDQVPDLGSKDAAIQLAGIWIVEFAEFLSIRSVDVNASKKWMTIRKDRYRAPYGRHSSDHPRQSVFGGTTNDHEFLSDPTGARRFWSAVCGEKIDIEALRRDRDQLFAEAVHRHRAGEPHWLDTADLQAAAAVEAEEHYIQHPWEALIQEWLIEGNKTVAFTNEILIKALGKLRSDLGRKDQMTVSACLVRLGWKKGKQIRSGLHKGDRPYYPPPDPDQQQKPPPEPPLWAKVKA